jgi:putative phage-type endonuclease
MNAREDWLQMRRTGLGGSDIGAILGLSPYRTPVDVWAEKTGRSPGQDETLQMRFGTYAEEFVSREYTVKTGNEVQRFTSMLRHPVAPVLGNVDRLVIPKGAKIASHKQEIRTDLGLECKTANAFAAFNSDDWGEEGTDQIPPSYLVQCATYMALTGCSLWDLAVLFGNQEVRIYNLKRDAELEGEIIARASEWWDRHIVADVAPEPTCDSDIKRLYPSDNGASVDANPKTLELIARAVELKTQIAALEVELEGDKKAGSIGVIGSLKGYMGEAQRLVLGADELITWKTSKPAQRFDSKAFQIAHPALYPQFLKTGEPVRRFLIKE